jgi:hypothetical protein
MSAVRFSTRNPQQESEPSGAPDEASIRAQLDRILASDLFQHSRRYPTLLRYVVEQALAGAAEDLKERTLGVTVFRRNPEYDTSADPVVRTTASEIRKRLEAYYAEPSHAGELRIALPVGSYVPEFRSAPAPEPLPSAADSVPAKDPRRWHILAIAASLFIMAGLGVTIRVGSEGNALHRFWQPMLEPSSPVPLVVETLMGVPKRPITQPAAAVSPRVEEILDPNLFLIVNEGNSRLAAWFGAHGKTLEYDLARNVTLAKLRERPFILKGAFNNPLTLRAVAPLRYSLNLDRNDRTAVVRQIVDRQNPARHWDSPMGDLAKDYALIVRAPEPRTGQTMVVIAGLGERGGAAATEFLTNPQYMERFDAQAPRGWEHRNLEIVLETELVNGDWGQPRIVATHVW